MQITLKDVITTEPYHVAKVLQKSVAEQFEA
jgi:hypothetical protein